MAELKLNNVTTITESSGSLTLANAALGTPTSVILTNATFPANHVLQVITSNKSTTQAVSSAASDDWQDVSDLSVAITPQTGNKVLVLFNIHVSAAADYQQHARLVRGSTGIGVGDIAGSKLGSSLMWRVSHAHRMENCASQYLDATPGGDGSTPITYKIQVQGESSSQDVYINMSRTEGADNYTWSRTHSSITVMEIQG